MEVVFQLHVAIIRVQGENNFRKDTMVQKLAPEPTALFQRFYKLADRILSAWDEEALRDEETNPRLITLAVQDLQTMLADLCGQYQESPPEEEITRCTDYALQLFHEMTHLARLINMEHEAVEVENLAFPFSLWGLRLGAEIVTLDPVVNAIARLANSEQPPGYLEELYREVSEVMQATAIEQQLEKTVSTQANPWKILLLNRAIIATRSHQPMLMDDAFSAIVEYLPEDAPTFFQEGMEQMDIVGYPMQVRDIMMAWFHRYAKKPTLH